MDQLMTTYGYPTPNALLQNNTLFQSMHSPHDVPGVLFWHIEDCQKIQMLGDNPYTPTKLLNNAIRLLLGWGFYHHDFKEWDCNAVGPSAKAKDAGHTGEEGGADSNLRKSDYLEKEKKVL